MAIFAHLPNMIIVDPLTEKHAETLADYFINSKDPRSIYFRLRRTPVPLLRVLDRVRDARRLSPVDPIIINPDQQNSGLGFVVMGTVAAKLALDCASNWALGSSIIILSVLGDGCNEELGDFIQNCETICTIEDDSGALKQYVQDFLLNMMNKGSFDISVHRPAPLLVSKTVTKPSPHFVLSRHALPFMASLPTEYRKCWRKASQAEARQD